MQRGQGGTREEAGVEGEDGEEKNSIQFDLNCVEDEEQIDD
jgi:hypothetical protein